MLRQNPNLNKKKFNQSAMCKEWDKKPKSALAPPVPWRINRRDGKIPDLQSTDIAFITSTLSCCYCTKWTVDNNRTRYHPGFYYCARCSAAICIECLVLLFGEDRNRLKAGSRKARTNSKLCITCILKREQTNVCLYCFQICKFIIYIYILLALIV